MDVIGPSRLAKLGTITDMKILDVQAPPTGQQVAVLTAPVSSITPTLAPDDPARGGGRRAAGTP